MNLRDIRDLVRQVKEKRKEQDISLRGLSGRVGISFSLLARFEREEEVPSERIIPILRRWLLTPLSESAPSLQDALEDRVSKLEQQVRYLRRCLVNSGE